MIDFDIENIEIRMKVVGRSGGSELWRLAENYIFYIELISIDTLKSRAGV